MVIKGLFCTLCNLIEKLNNVLIIFEELFVSGQLLFTNFTMLIFSWNYFEHETNGNASQILISAHSWKSVDYGTVIRRVLDLTSDMVEMVNKVLPSSVTKEGRELHKYNVQKVSDFIMKIFSVF